MSINARTLALLSQRREQLLALDSEQVLTLTTAYVQAWDRLRPEYEASLTELMAAAKDGRVRQADVAANLRLQRALEATLADLQELAELTNKTITAAIPQALEIAGSSQVAAIASQLPPGSAGIVTDWAMVNPDALRAIIQRSTERIEKATDPLPADVQSIMKRELVRGIATGTNPRQTASRIVRESEGRFNGGLTRALNIARTETISAHNAAAYEADKLNADVLRGWAWGAELSARTCIACISKHGTEYPPDVEGPHGHHACRCTRISLTKSWADLGFAGIKEPPSLMQDSEQWFDGLTPASQREIMGPRRLELYQSGAVGWQDLNRTQDNPGWRPSVTITPLKDLPKTA